MKKRILLVCAMMAWSACEKNPTVDATKNVEPLPTPVVESKPTVEKKAPEKKPEISEDMPKPLNDKPVLAQFLPPTLNGALRLPDQPSVREAKREVSATYMTTIDGKRSTITLKISDLQRGAKRTTLGLKADEERVEKTITYKGENVGGRFMETSVDTAKKQATATTTINDALQVAVTVRPSSSSEIPKKYLASVNYLGMALHLRKARNAAPLK